ncbi:MAG: tyrosine-protein phosphatase [Phycisphaerae bacterium]
MIDSVNGNIIDTQDHHLKGYGWEKFTDIHCHCLFGLDDGPATMAESLALCRRLVKENIATVVATPHQLGRFDGCNKAANVREAVNDLNKALRNSDVPVKIIPGGEVRVDERVCQFLEADKILTLADGGKYILLELPYQVFIDIEPLLIELASMGIQLVISHAEKIASLATQHQIILRWLEHSAHLQITASSLLGDFGPEVQRAAWYLLTSGLATLVATDSHDTNLRRPQMRAAFGRISNKLGEDLARLVCIENPSRVINGQDILPVSLYDRPEVER